jgi:hypothetical protein
MVYFDLTTMMFSMCGVALHLKEQFDPWKFRVRLEFLISENSHLWNRN